ncbi:MAG TPA: hypothetical protein VGE98_05605 [Thermoanaerobaculia bacterium]
MKVTIDLPAKELQQVLENTEAATVSEAVCVAVRELNRRKRLQRLTEKFGTLDGFGTSEELQTMSLADRPEGEEPLAAENVRFILRKKAKKASRESDREKS